MTSRWHIWIVGVAAVVIAVALLGIWNFVAVAVAVWHLVVGWGYFLGRVVPQLNPAPGEVISAVVSLALVVFGTHRFCRWLASSASPGSPWPWRRTLRLVGLFVLLFAAGTATVGVTHQVAWLARSPEPVVVRTSFASAISAQSDLGQIAAAGFNFNHYNGHLPAPTFTPAGRPLHSWHAQILPQMELEPIYRQMRHDVPWNHPDNKEAIQRRIRTYEHPAAPNPPPGPGLTHFVPDARLFDRPRSTSRPADFPHGLANTLLLGEAIANERPWADPLNWRDPRLGANHPHGFNGPRPDRVTVAMADGSVRIVTVAGWDRLVHGEPDE